MRRLGELHVHLHLLNVRINVAVYHQNIRPAIQVVVEKETSKPERQQGSAAHVRARRFINEQSLAFVVIEGNHLIREIRNHQTDIYATAAESFLCTIPACSTICSCRPSCSKDRSPATTAHSCQRPDRACRLCHNRPTRRWC